MCDLSESQKALSTPKVRPKPPSNQLRTPKLERFLYMASILGPILRHSLTPRMHLTKALFVYINLKGP
jgi:hypothetical protein